MAFRALSASLLICLLLVAALACLAAGLHLLTGTALLGRGAALAIAALGGLVVFLLGAAGLVTVRRFLAAGRASNPAPVLELPVVDARAWSRDLSALRDDLRDDLRQDVQLDLRDNLRRDGAAAERLDEFRDRELLVPGSFRPRGHYLLDPDGRSTDPLDDLKRTRDQLLDAAARVDTIVQSIDLATTPPPRPSLLGSLASIFRPQRKTD